MACNVSSFKGWCQQGLIERRLAEVELGEPVVRTKTVTARTRTKRIAFTQAFQRVFEALVFGGCFERITSNHAFGWALRVLCLPRYRGTARHAHTRSAQATVTVRGIL